MNLVRCIVTLHHKRVALTYLTTPPARPQGTPSTPVLAACSDFVTDLVFPLTLAGRG